jgi:hypothetical protein
VWHWLAEAKQNSLLDWLRQHYRLIALTWVLLVTIYLAWAFQNALALPPHWIFVIGLSGLICLLFGLKVIQLTLRAPTLFRAVVRATIIVGVTLTPAPIFLTLVFIFKVELLGFAKAFGVAVASNELTLVQALFAFSYLWAFILCFHLTVIAVIFWAVVALPLLAIYLLTIVLFCSEFIVRRIAEHPKGPIVAGSVLLVALLGVLRIILTGK